MESFLCPELFDQIIDSIWDEIVTTLDTRMFLSLTLVNKQCKRLLCQRRKSLMLAQATAFRQGIHSPSLLTRFKDPFSNPYISTLEVLAHIALRFDAKLLGDYLAPLVLKHQARIDTLLHHSPGPLVMCTEKGRTGLLTEVYAACVGQCVSLCSGDLIFVLKNVKRTVHAFTWDFGVVSMHSKMVVLFNVSPEYSVTTVVLNIFSNNFF
ncbi:hypothetical protein DFJ77DRAFT_473385 [Powellomyces hirtus]|nr:hypothetical protein DFJ77DRAFT_473385 [Powellomyces hirtus]